MRALSLSFLLCFVLLLVAATIVCHIIALATDYWLQSSDDYQTHFLNLGLFVACFDRYKHKHENPQKTYDGCLPLHNEKYDSIRDWLDPSWLEACRVLAIIALILQLVGLVLVILLLLWWFCKAVCCEDRRDCCERVMIYAAPILFIVAGMFLMCVVMLFADNAFRLQCKDYWVGGDPNNNELAYSWGFEIAACITAFLAGGFLIWLVVLKAREDL